MTRYFFDIGFNDDGVILDFINIAIIKKDGTEYQAFNSSLDLSYYSEPLVEQLMKLLPPRDELGLWKSSVEIAKEVFVFLGGQVDQNGCRKPLQATPELFTYSLGSHKWVAFCQLFGSHEDLPLGFPEYCQDLKQQYDWLDHLPLPLPPELHSGPLELARWNKKTFDLINPVFKTA